MLARRRERPVRYGETSKRCYCPVVRDRPAKPSDLHCECTRATHQSIFEAALGRPVPVEVVNESVQAEEDYEPTEDAEGL